MRRIGVLVCCAMLLAGLGGCATGNLGNGSKTAEVLASKARASKAYAAGDRAQALDAYKQYVALNPRDAGAWTRIGNLYLMENGAEQAVDAYRKALQIDRTDVEAWHNLTLVRLRQAHATMIAEYGQLDHDEKSRGKLACKIAWLSLLEGDSSKQAPDCIP